MKILHRYSRISFGCGILIGFVGRELLVQLFGSLGRQRAPPSFAVSSAQVPLQPTSHPGIQKRQLFPSFAVDNVAGCALTDLTINVEPHAHLSMHEFFYIIEGRGTATLHGKPATLQSGSFVYTAPGEVHSFQVENGSRGLLKFYCQFVVP